MNKIIVLLLLAPVCWADPITSVPPTPVGGGCIIFYPDKQDDTRNITPLQAVVTDSINVFGPSTAYRCKIVAWDGDMSENLYLGNDTTSITERGTLDTESARLDAAGFDNLIAPGNHDVPLTSYPHPDAWAQFAKGRLQPGGVSKSYFRGTYQEPGGGHTWASALYSTTLGGRPLYVAQLGPAAGLMVSNMPTIEGGDNGTFDAAALAAYTAWAKADADAWVAANPTGIVILMNHVGWQNCALDWDPNQAPPVNWSYIRMWATGHWDVPSATNGGDQKLKTAAGYNPSQTVPHVQFDYQQTQCGVGRLGIMIVMTISLDGQVTYCPWDAINHQWWDTASCGQFNIPVQNTRTSGYIKLSGVTIH